MEARRQTVMNDTAQQNPEPTQIRVQISGRLSDPNLSRWGEWGALTESEPDRLPVLWFGTDATVDDEVPCERGGDRRDARTRSAPQCGISGPSPRVEVSW